MEGRKRAGRWRALPVAAALMAAAMASALPTAAHDRDPTQVLPGATLTAVSADLNGDGSHEVVRIVGGASGRLLVDAWRLAGDRWVVAGSAELPQPAGGPHGVVFTDPGMGSLLAWSNDGRGEVLALSAAMDAISGDPCCLAIHRVRLTDVGLTVVPMEGDPGGVDQLRTVDLDGDGTDELLAIQTTYADDEDRGTTRLTVLRWDGVRWERWHELEHRGASFGLGIGDSDGLPGAEVLVGPSRWGELIRIAWEDGRIVTESGHVETGGRVGGWIAGVPDGRIVVSVANGIRVLDWPRGQAPRTVARSAAIAFPSVSVVGGGPDALVVVLDGIYFPRDAPPRMTIMDIDLEPLGSVEMDPSAAALWELADATTGTIGLSRNLFPYVGPMAGGHGQGRAGYVAGGTLVEPADGGFALRPAAMLIGMQPVARAGREGFWVAIGQGLIGGTETVSMLQGGPGPFWPGRLTLTPLGVLLGGDLQAEAASVELRGAVEIARDGLDASLLAEADGFTATVTAAPGSVAIVVAGLLAQEHRIADAPLELEVRAPSSPADEDRAFERWLVVTSPNGHASVARWQGTFVRNPPQLEVYADTSLFSLRSTILGRASDGATVLVDGRPVTLRPDGTFSIEVDAPIWPRDVTVIARDPIGNETVNRVDVIGVVDHRSLPWIPIVAVATLGLGVAMFVRTPSHRLERRMELDGTLEEIDTPAP